MFMHKREEIFDRMRAGTLHPGCVDFGADPCPEEWPVDFMKFVSFKCKLTDAELENIARVARPEHADHIRPAAVPLLLRGIHCELYCTKLEEQGIPLEFRQSAVRDLLLHTLGDISGNDLFIRALFYAVGHYTNTGHFMRVYAEICTKLGDVPIVTDGIECTTLEDMYSPDMSLDACVDLIKLDLDDVELMQGEMLGVCHIPGVHEDTSALELESQYALLVRLHEKDTAVAAAFKAQMTLLPWEISVMLLHKFAAGEAGEYMYLM
jgi:hypothetical protein